MNRVWMQNYDLLQNLFRIYLFRIVINYALRFN